MVTAAAIAADITTIAQAAQAAGVSHVRLRRGPVAELVVMPPMQGPEPEDTSVAGQKKRARERERTLYGEPLPGEESDGLR